MTEPEVNAFVPTFQQVKEIATATGLDEKDLAAVILGLQSIKVVFAQIKEPAQGPVEARNGTESSAGASSSELADSVSAIAAEFSDK